MADSETSTTLSSPSRRDLLAGSLAAAGLPLLAASTFAANISADPAIVAWQRWRQAHQRFLRLCDKQQSLESTLFALIGFPHVMVTHPDGWEPIRIGSLHELDTMVAKFPALEDQRSMIATQLEAHQARWDELDHHLGYSTALHEERCAAADERQLAEELFAAPATTLHGMAAKLDALITIGVASEDSADFPWPQLQQMRSELLKAQTN